MSLHDSPGALTDVVERLARNRSIVQDLIDSPDHLTVGFEPMIDIATGAVVAYRSRTRGSTEAGTANHAELIAASEGTGLLERLDWSYRVHVLALARGLTLPLHLTPEPVTYGSPCPPRLAAAFGEARRSLTLAAELPLAAYDDPSSLLRGVAEHRQWGWRVVSDDVGDSPAALGLLDEIRPDWIRLDLDLPGRQPASLAPGVQQMLDWARASGATVLGHGVDSPSRRSAAEELGATVIRGGVVGTPGSLPASVLGR